MKRLKIIYFMSEKSNYLGGADQTLFMQAVLMNLYHNVTLVLPCESNGKCSSRFLKKCKEYNMEYAVLSYTTSYRIVGLDMIDCKDEIENIEKFIRGKNIDILHSVQINPAVEYVSRKYHIPHVMNIYSLQEWEWKIPYCDIFPSIISSDSELYLKKWKDYINCKGKCVRVFSDMAMKEKKIEAKDLLVLGVSGTICAYKNQLEIIKAVEMEVKQGRQITLLLAGNNSSSYALKCENYIRENGLGDWIKILGFMEDMKSFYGEIDALLCGSTRESFPASIVEAISCNIPIISTPVAGVPEILTDRKNAYLAKGYLAPELAEAINCFYEDWVNQRLGYILFNERKTYQKFFSAKAVSGQLNRLYKYMLKETQSKHIDVWDDISVRLDAMMDKLEKKNILPEDMACIKKRLVYFLHLSDKVAGKKCYIWGAGQWGRITKLLLEHIVSKITILAFVDKQKRGSMDGIEIIRKEDMNDQDAIVFISFINGQDEAIQYLEDKGLKILENVFVIA